MEMKTEQQIKDQLELLRLERLGIPQRNFFGEDNWTPIDARTGILHDQLESPKSKTAVEDMRDNALELGGDAPDPALQARIEALDWLLGDHDDMVEADDNWVKKGRALDAELKAAVTAPAPALGRSKAKKATAKKRK
jgi:hypothetical protein